MAGVAGTPPVWTSGRWAGRVRLPFPPRGAGHRQIRQVGAGEQQHTETGSSQAEQHDAVPRRHEVALAREAEADVGLIVRMCRGDLVGDAR